MGIQHDGADDAPQWWPPLAIYPGTYARATHAPGYRHPKHGFDTWDWRAAPGSPPNRAKVRACGQRLAADAALDRAWGSPAMLVGYVVRGPDGALLPWQPRVAKDAVPWLAGEGYALAFHSVWLDYDTPGHVP